MGPNTSENFENLERAPKKLRAHQTLREKLDKHILQALNWNDTRDMQADGMTKGGIDREAVE